MSEAPAQVPVWNPEGDLVQIPASEFDQGAMAQGYRPASPEEVQAFTNEQKYGDVKGAIGAFTTSAGNMLTGGLYAKGLTAISPDPQATQEQLRGEKEAHPIAGMAGSLTGVAVGSMIPGSVPSQIMKAGKAVSGLGAGAATVAGRVLPAAAGAAVEGGLFGLEDVVERHFLGDPNLTAEKAMAEIGLSALVPGLIVGGGKLIGEAVAPLADRLIAKGARTAEAQALQEAAKEEASLTGATGQKAANAYRQIEKINLQLADPALPAEERAALEAFRASPEYADLLKSSAQSTIEHAPEAVAEFRGAQGALAEFQAGKATQIAERTAALTEPGRVGDLVYDRVIKRYGSRAALGWLLGSATGVGGPIGTLGGISYGYMKDVIKRIARDPSMFMTLGRLLKSPVETLSAMAGLARLTSTTDEAIASGVGAIFGGGVAAGSAEASGKFLDAKSFGHVASNLGNYASDLDRLAEDTSRQTEGVRDHAPATSDALHGLAARGVQYLNGQAPRAQQQPLDRPYQPSRSELTQFNRAHEIAQRPTNVLAHVAKGTLTPEHLQTLAAIYPRLYQEMQAQVLDRLSKEMAKGNHIPYRTRLSVGMFLGQNLDSTTMPVHMAANVAAVAKAPRAPMPALKESGLAKVKMGDRMQTPSQAAAQREV